MPTTIEVSVPDIGDLKDVPVIELLDCFTPTINAPEVAILGVCKSSTEPRWDGRRCTAAPPRRRALPSGSAVL